MGIFDRPKNTPTPTQDQPPKNDGVQDQTDASDHKDQAPVNPAEYSNKTWYLYRELGGYFRLYNSRLMFSPLLKPDDSADDSRDHDAEVEADIEKIGEKRYNEIVSELRSRF